MSNGLIVADVPSSAIASSSRGWSSALQAELIFASEFWSPADLLQYVLRKKPRWVLFSWRKALIDISQKRSNLNQLNELRKATLLGISIPDYLGWIYPPFTSWEEVAIPQLDFVTLTSDPLRRAYEEKFPSVDFHTLFDMPNHQLLMKIRSERLKKDLDLIWVGNSQWGLRQGIYDHKGYFTHVVPLLNSLATKKPSISATVLDRSNSMLDQEQVLRLIARSRYLIQFSRSEGTGLPILEAMALGTIPLTTDVGVARQVLDEYADDLIVQAISEAKNVIETQQFLNLSELIQNKYDDHVQSVLKNLSLLKANLNDLASSTIGRPLGVPNNSQCSIVKEQAMWLLRFLRARIRR